MNLEHTICILKVIIMNEYEGKLKLDITFKPMQEEFKMKRSMMQAYVTRSNEAVALYQEAFDAVLISSYPNEDGTFFHSELDIEGEILAVAERNSEYAMVGGQAVTGNTMQFCLHYGEGKEDKVRKAYEVLKHDATILMPLAPCDFSPLMADFIDKYGVRWCLFV
jgi:PhnB protein